MNPLIDSEHQSRISLNTTATAEWLTQLVNLIDDNGGDVGLHNDFNLDRGPSTNEFTITADWAPQTIRAEDAISSTRATRTAYGEATGNLEHLILAIGELGFLRTLPGVELRLELAGPGCYEWVIWGDRYSFFRLVSEPFQLKDIGDPTKTGAEQAMMILIEGVITGNALLSNFMTAASRAFTDHTTDPVILRRLIDVGDVRVQAAARANPHLAG